MSLEPATESANVAAVMDLPEPVMSVTLPSARTFGFAVATLAASAAV